MLFKKTPAEAKKVGKQTILKGIVVSDKMKDTVVVLVEGFKKHTKYEKFLKTRNRFKAHNPGNTKKLGDVVEITPCRPISKDKKFVVVK